MTLLIALLWLVTLGAVAFACYGARRWHRTFTAHVRPDAAEPSPRGYQLLAWRNWLVALTAVALCTGASFATVVVSEEQLYDAADVAMDQPSGAFASIDAIVAVIEDDLGRDVSYAKITTDDATSRRTYELSTPWSGLGTVCIHVDPAPDGGLDVQGRSTGGCVT
jgi:hypothetical protein